MATSLMIFDSINEKKDYMSMIKEFMQLQYDSNNLSGYLSYKELYDYINDRNREVIQLNGNIK